MNKKFIILASLTIFYILVCIQVGFTTTLALFVTWSLMSIVFRGHLELFSLADKLLTNGVDYFFKNKAYKYKPNFK